MLARNAILSLLLLLAPAQAGDMRVWQLKESADAPVLVVGRVLSIQKNRLLRPGEVRWKYKTWSMTADIEVLRAYPKEDTPAAIRVHYLQYDPTVKSLANGQPPPLPRFVTHAVLILPLERGKRPEDSWELIGDDGEFLVLPTRAEYPDAESDTPSGRAFLLGEIVNNLSRGTPAQVYAFARYLSSQDEDLRGDLMPRLKAAIGKNRLRWAEVACNLYAVKGSLKPTAAELMAGNDIVPSSQFRPSLTLVQATLKELKASPETDALLIHRWLSVGPSPAWGAGPLLEYAEHPVAIAGLRQALRDGLKGGLQTAWYLVRAGHVDVLPDALARAEKVLTLPNPNTEEMVDGVTQLVLDRGDDRQVQQLMAAIRKYQTQDVETYRRLLEMAALAHNPRRFRVIALVLGDHRISHDTFRYCDVAAGWLERSVEEDFGIRNAKTQEERDRTVLRAQAWLQEHGVTP